MISTCTVRNASAICAYIQDRSVALHLGHEFDGHAKRAHDLTLKRSRALNLVLKRIPVAPDIVTRINKNKHFKDTLQLTLEESSEEEGATTVGQS